MPASFPFRVTGRRTLRVLLTLAAAALGTSLSAAPAQRGAPVPLADAPPRTKLALVIGISNYRYASRVPGAARDAVAFARFLQERWGFPPERVTLMTDDAPDPARRPTRDHLIAEVRRLASDLRRDDQLVFFFAGHGARPGREEWLVPLDGDSTRETETCVSLDRLVEELTMKRCRRALLFIDADRHSPTVEIAKTQSLLVKARALGAPEIGILYSCEVGERSWEGKPSDFEARVFTHFLLRALQDDPEAGKDSTLSFDALRRYVRGQVRRYVAAEYRDEQSPYGLATHPEMPLAGRRPR